MDPGVVIGGIVGLAAALLVLSLWIWCIRILRDIRRSSREQVVLLQKQVQLLERQGQMQGWLPPQGTEPWRPPHLQR